MADKKLKIALCAGVAAVVILMILLLTTCTGGKEPEPTVPVQTQQMTEPTETQTTQPPTEVATEPTEVTEPATEPTEPEETQGSTGGSSTPGGGSGSGSSSDNDTPKPTEPFDAPAAGSQDNPYVEVLSGSVQEISTVSLKAKESVYYEIYGAAGSVLLLEAKDVSLTMGETVCQPDESGLITLPIGADAEPAILQLTNSGTAEVAYRLRFAERGSAANPEKLESIASIKVELAEGDEDGYHYVWTATDTCEVTFLPAKPGYLIHATYGGITASNADSADGSLALNVYLGMTVELKVVAVPDEEDNYPAISDVITGTVPQKGSMKNPIVLETLTPDPLELAGGADFRRYCVWTAETAGTFEVQVTGAEPETVTCGVTLNPGKEPETSSLDTRAMETAASIEVEAGERVLICVETAPDETATYPAAKITFTCTFTVKPGLEENPIEVHVPEDTLSVPAGEMIYYKTSAAGMKMTITGENLRVIVSGTAYESEEGKIVISCGGSIVFTVTNLGEEDAVYSVTFVKINVDPNPKPTEPDPTEPEPTEPDVTEPDSTEPEVTEPDATEPDTTEPTPAEPDSTEPSATEPTGTTAATEENPGATES